MNRIAALICLLLLAFGASVYPQAVKSQANLESPPDRDLLQQVLSAWESMDLSRPAVFYAKDADLVFYDITPLKYTGWAEYEKGAIELNKKIKSLSFKLNNDVRCRHQGNLAWTTATVATELVNKDGSANKFDGRWTTLWEKRGNKWIIVHDHFSVPSGPEAPKPPMPKKP